MGEPNDYIYAPSLMNLYRGLATHLDITSPHTSYSSFHSINNYRTARLPKSLLLSLMPRPWMMLLLRMKRRQMRPWRRRPMNKPRRRLMSQQPRKLIVLPLRMPHLLLSSNCVWVHITYVIYIQGIFFTHV